MLFDRRFIVSAALLLSACSGDLARCEARSERDLRLYQRKVEDYKFDLEQARKRSDEYRKLYEKELWACNPKDKCAKWVRIAVKEQEQICTIREAVVRRSRCGAK